jgi:hypothetical protein
MPRFVEILISVFAQSVAAIGILIGWGYVAPLVQYVSAAMQGQPWLAGELALRIVRVTGPVLLGMSVIVGVVWLLWSSHVTRTRMRQHPTEPWMWQPEWAEKSIQLSNRLAIGIVAVSATFYGLVVVPLGIYLASLKNAWVVYSFVRVVVFFLLIYFRILWVNRRWNRSHLQLDTLPGVIGGHFAAVATIPESLPAGTVLRVALRCDMTRRSSTPADGREDLVDAVIGTQRSSNGHSTMRTSSIFEDSTTVTIETATGDAAPRPAPETVIPISFPIPNDLPSSGKQPSVPSDDPYRRTRITDFCQWHVQIRLEQSSRLQEVLFEVPVFSLASSQEPST